ncbi:hypothetical protein [Corynebacterium auriscanis]|uniref:hypothetical protein n=1 Tax=Corynebacterium auriscanis TaxID=99807 RepID=UPI003CF755A0
MAGISARSSNSPHHCKWCGRAITDQPSRGRRRQYCSQACRQRAYEHRNLTTHPASATENEHPSGTVTLGPKAASNLKDLMYQLRCAAEDVRTAAEEKASHDEIRGLADEVLQLAQSIERIRALGPAEGPAEWPAEK